jgi:uncharacterized membrane protein
MQVVAAAVFKYQVKQLVPVVQAVVVAVVLGMVLLGDLVVLPEDNREHQEDLYLHLPHLVLGHPLRPMGGVVMVEPIPAVVVVGWELALHTVVLVVPAS